MDAKDAAMEMMEDDMEDAGGRKIKFPAYVDEETIEKGLKDGTYLKGVLRVSITKPSTAYVNDPKNPNRPLGNQDIQVRGRHARNRAVHGDIVIIQIFDVSTERRRHGDDDEDEVIDQELEDEEAHRAPVAAAAGADDDSSDDEVVFKGGVVSGGDAKLEAFAKAGVAPKRGLALARVVAIADPRGQSRVIVCTLHANRPNEVLGGKLSEAVVEEGDKFIKAKPTDKRMPWVLIQVNDVTRQILDIPGKLNKYAMWPVQILKWNENSVLPLGRLKGQCIGQAGELEAECRHVLIEHELDDHDVDFDDDLFDEVDDIVARADAEFEEEASRRLDLRDKRIFTIDPATAKDLDDAIHVERDDARGQVEIGVHIADVGHFLKLGEMTDKEAQRRTTSVYLVDRVLPMLPHALCNHLCSLNGGEPKLSFSAFFRLDMQTGELVQDPPPWFRKTAMTSCCRLNYDEVQRVLDGHEIDVPPIHNPKYKWQDIKDDIFLLYDVCGKVRRGRMDGGALSITKTKMVFHTRESENGIPTNYHLESHSASHWIIEELMLLANRCVAAFLYSSPLSEVAVLRKHEAPEDKKAEQLSNLLKQNLGIQFWDGTSAGRLYRSLQEVHRRYGPMLGMCIEMMTMRGGMQQAQYFVVNEEENPHHFALNFDYYTHFTSPIRRYPDVMVHRVLAALLDDNDGSAYQNTEDAVDQVRECNDKRMKARRAQEQLDRAVFCVYLRARKEWFYTVGSVLEIKSGRSQEQGGADMITVYCSQLGRESRIRLVPAGTPHPELFDDGVDDEVHMPETWRLRGRGEVTLEWNPPANAQGNRTLQKLRLLSCVPVVIVPTDTVPIDYSMFFVSPFHSKYTYVTENISEQAAAGFDFNEMEEEGVDIVHEADF
mmetsp:Transcript_64835/g.154789  ORF Transcript_64835/g.154789 Transcript_64835/m.154789 type:complete len:886 (+) Transcript_64835:94-2751(+)